MDDLFPVDPTKSPFGDSQVNITKGDWRDQCTAADEKSAEDKEFMYGIEIHVVEEVLYAICKYIFRINSATNSTMNMGLNLGFTAMREIFGAQKREEKLVSL